jgi:hypothetical protein
MMTVKIELHGAGFPEIDAPWSLLRCGAVE